LCGESRSWAAPAPGDDGGRRRGRRELFQIILKLGGLFCKITNELRPRHVFRDGGSIIFILEKNRV
uniref:Uncharacterized protein n=1 Tax=Aegilops tauschii subsp. strangulata TaxID=200361 RepID=A0A453F983_AEGTS